MKTFEPGKHYVKELNTGRISIRVSHWSRKDTVNSIFTASSDGIWDLQENITPEQARELAANLLDHADEVETHLKQISEVVL